MKGLRFKEGDFVEMIKRNHGHAFEIGETVMISIAEKGNNGDCCDVYSPGWQKNPFYSVFNREGCCMSIGDCEVKLSTKEKFNKVILERTMGDKLKMFKSKSPSGLKNYTLQF